MSRKDNPVGKEDTIGARLRLARQEKNITLTDMAKFLNYSTGYLSGIETGLTRVSRDIARKYEKQLALDPGCLVNSLEPEREECIWSVPYEQNVFFTGREEIISHIHRVLTNTKKLPYTFVLRGLGGIGKTQVAIEYAYRYRTFYTAIFWLRAEALKEQFHEIGALIQNQKDVKDEEIKHWLRENSPCLIIVDSLDDLGSLEVSRKLLSHLGNTRILITSRLQSVTIPAQVLELEKMSEQESILLLLRRISVLTPQDHLIDAPNSERMQALDIARVIDGLPLAIDQAASYIQETGCRLSDYYTLFLKEQNRLLKERGKFFVDHPNSVSTTWSLAFEEIKHDTPEAIDFLHLCAFLYPDDIYIDFFLKSEPALDFPLKAAFEDQVLFYRIVGTLRRYSLIRFNPNSNTLNMHRLMQTVVKGTMNQDEQRAWAEKVIRALNYVFPLIEATHWIGTRAECRKYFLQAQFGIKIMRDWNIVSSEAMQLQGKMARFLEEVSSFDEAEEAYLETIKISKQVDNLDIEQLILNYGLFAAFLEGMKKFKQAEEYYKEAIKAWERASQDHRNYTSPSIATIWQRYAALLVKVEKKSEALRWKERASQYSNTDLVHSIVNDDEKDIIFYQGKWSLRNKQSGSYGENVHYTESSGASFEATFHGVAVAILCDANSAEGIIDVYLDGNHLERKDTKGLSENSSRFEQTVLFYKDKLDDNTHTIRGEVVQGNFALDALVFFSPSSNIGI